MDVVLQDKNGDNLLTSKDRSLGTFKRLPDMTQLVMEGKVWTVQDQTSTAILVAPPTTTAGLTMQNPSSSGKYYIVFAISELVDVNPAALTSWTTWHCAHKLAQAALTRDISLASTGAGAICGLKAGQGAYSGVVVLDRGATVIDDGWAPAIPQTSNVVNSQADIHRVVALVVPVIVPPSFSYSLAGVGGSTTTEMGNGFVWAEVDEDDLLLA